jgi:glycosyltransferase involved in cell wall biosynthesis
VEHIIIDACSTDDTLAVLKTYPHLNWVSEPDNGQTDAINKGFRKATGDWLMWLNADDYLLPGTLAKVRSHALAHPAAEIVYGECLFVDEHKRVLRRRREGPFDFNMLLYYGCYIPSTSAFYRRTLLDDGFLLDPSFKVCMDFDYYMRLALAGKQFSFLPDALACFRWHETNASSVLAQRRKEERLRVQRHALDQLGRGWLGNETILRCLFRAYQLKRMFRRLVSP